MYFIYLVLSIFYEHIDLKPLLVKAWAMQSQTARSSKFQYFDRLTYRTLNIQKQRMLQRCLLFISHIMKKPKATALVNFSIL